MIGFISDIHGNYPALMAVLAELDRLHCDTIYCLGDIVGYYCMPNECISELRSRNIKCLQGNHDYYLISGGCCDSKTVKMCIEYQRKVILPEHYEWLKTLRPLFDTGVFSMRHAGWNDALEERVDDFDFNTARYYRQRYFISGHSHKQDLSQCLNIQYCNPGSVGQPRDGDPRAAYAVWNQETGFAINRIQYPIDEIRDEMIAQQQGDWIWKCLYEGKKIGG